MSESNQNHPRGFKGIWIPRELWLDERLSAEEKILLAEIDSLDCGSPRHCFASNDHLCKFMKCKLRTLQEMLSNLRNLGFIEYVGTNGRERNIKSNLESIYAKFRTSDMHDKNKLKHDMQNFAPPQCEISHPPLIDSFPEAENKDENKERDPLSPSSLRSEEEKGSLLSEISSPTKEIPSPSSPSSEESQRIAKLLFEKIQVVNPKAKIPNFNKWSEIIDLMHRRDGRSIEDILKVIDWAFEDAFWYKTLQSAESLRRNFDKMLTKMSPVKNQSEQEKENKKIAFMLLDHLKNVGRKTEIRFYEDAIYSNVKKESVKFNLPKQSFIEAINEVFRVKFIG